MLSDFNASSGLGCEDPLRSGFATLDAALPQRIRSDSPGCGIPPAPTFSDAESQAQRGIVRNLVAGTR